MKDDNDDKFAKRYGETYSDLRSDKRASIFFNFLFLMRRLIFVVVSMDFSARVHLQISS